MRTTITLTTILAALLMAMPAQAATAPTIAKPILGIPRASGSLVFGSSYDIALGTPKDTGEITFTILRHRPHRSGFKVVGIVTRTVVTPAGVYNAVVPWMTVGGYDPTAGYRIRPMITNLRTGETATAHAAKLAPFALEES